METLSHIKTSVVVLLVADKLSNSRVVWSHTHFFQGKLCHEQQTATIGTKYLKSSSTSKHNTTCLDVIILDDTELSRNASVRDGLPCRLRLAAQTSLHMQSRVSSLCSIKFKGSNSSRKLAEIFCQVGGKGKWQTSLILPPQQTKQKCISAIFHWIE